MKTFAAALCVLPFLTFATAGQRAATSLPRPAALATPRALTPDEQLFTGLIEQLGAAVEQHNMVALGKFMAPEYVHYNPDNGSGTRAEELAFIGTWGKTRAQLVGPVRVNRYGNTAVTVSSTTWTFSGAGGAPGSVTTTQMMIVWVLRAGTWQMAVVQSKKLA